MNASEFNLNRIDRLRYRPTLEAEEFIEDLRRARPGRPTLHPFGVDAR
uniref:Uncharacterized protein n=1 Tax=Candidatus Kentrum sp. LPFa TaxID=2126335 RepID=A0A450XLU8_9GAMM|nr:MAG: hypothetical protein BECKLPF1236A_GA0070988_1010411 [Candidatus Kentron sp. LPFa]VFK30236.1 MAG: hypothetical protein BECKLPF1236C_GA0070990_1010511 [Candidatus Kentron sp. LPFa]